MSPLRLWPLTDCTTNYRAVLWSERAPVTKSKATVRQKKGKRKIRSWAPNGCPTPRRIGRMTVDHNTNWTQLKLNSLSVCRYIGQEFPLRAGNSCAVYSVPKHPIPRTERQVGGTRVCVCCRHWQMGTSCEAWTAFFGSNTRVAGSNATRIICVCVGFCNVFVVLATCYMLVSCSADFRPWRWRWYAPMKRRFKYVLHTISQRIAKFITLWNWS
jgi:hypothetical protein